MPFHHDLFLILIFQTINISFQGIITPCLAAQECKDISLVLSTTGKSIKCSSNGKCFYDLEGYIIKNSTNEDFWTCVCDEGYTNDWNEETDIRCCYKQKSQFYAFILEIIPGFGAGHFYVGQTILGTIKLCLIIFLLWVKFICSYCANSIRKAEIENEQMWDTNKQQDNYGVATTAMIWNGISIMAIFFVFAWQVIDTFLFGFNYYEDGNGVSLQSW